MLLHSGALRSLSGSLVVSMFRSAVHILSKDLIDSQVRSERTGPSMPMHGESILTHIIVTLPMVSRALVYLEKFYCERNLGNTSSCLWALWFCHCCKMPVSSQIWSLEFGKESCHCVTRSMSKHSCSETSGQGPGETSDLVLSQPYTCTIHCLSSLLTVSHHLLHTHQCRTMFSA